MPPRKRRHPLFSAYGLAVDHAIVHRESLEVLPLAQAVMGSASTVAMPAGERRDLEIAPGAAAHSISFRSNKAMRKPHKWGRKFTVLSAQVQALLNEHQAILLPGGAHPFYVPKRDTVDGGGLTPEVRAACNKIFDTRSHGWRNDQALRLDICFDKPDEFGKLHAAVRLLMPLIPALTAASPVLEGRIAGALDARLEARMHAFDRVPVLVGQLVPEAVFDPEEHDREILGPIAQALAAVDQDRVLDPQEMNMRGAATQFDRGIMSLHVIDAQEAPSANMAVVEFFIAVLKALVSGRWVSTYLQRAWSAEELKGVLLETVTAADRAIITNRDLLLMFGLMKQDNMPVLKVWQHLFVELYSELGPAARNHIAQLLEHGTLASRLLARIGTRPTADKMRMAYLALARSHAEDRFFL